MSLYPFSAYGTAKRNAFQNKKLCLPLKYIFSEEDVLIKTSESELRQKWSGYQEVFMSKRFYFLVQNKQLVGFIPKSAFQNKESESHLRKMIIRHFSKIQTIGKGLSGWKLMILTIIISFVFSYGVLALMKQ
jgi:hypothetical protein